jgi:rubrerythrin
MTIEQAIKTALDFEVKVRDAYLQAAKTAISETGRKIFKTLGQEEQSHVNYLRERLEEWQKTGKVKAARLKTVVPSAKKIADGVAKLKSHLPKEVDGSERDLLEKALELEKETSAFYEKMAAEMAKDSEVFERFLEIEKGHVAIVQAEMDYLNKSGYFFDFQDFGMV